MIEGVFGRIEGGAVIGWAYNQDSSDPVFIEVKLANRVIAVGSADLLRQDLLSTASSRKGLVGYKVQLPKGKKVWHLIEVYGNGVQISKSPQLIQKIELTRRSLILEMEDPFFFIHIPKTAGTAFKQLLEEQYAPDAIFPSRSIVKNNRGQYPLLKELIKWKEPPKSSQLLLGHYPYATKRIIKGKSRELVIFRDPVERVISNIYHMKNNDSNLKAKSPEEIYDHGKWHYRNLQVRYMCDRFIHPSMRYIDAKLLGPRQLKLAVENMRECALVGISESLESTVSLANRMFGWDLNTPQRINIARSQKPISETLRKRIVADNTLDQKLYNQAVKRFNFLCKKHLS